MVGTIFVTDANAVPPPRHPCCDLLKFPGQKEIIFPSRPPRFLPPLHDTTALILDRIHGLGIRVHDNNGARDLRLEIAVHPRRTYAGGASETAFAATRPDKDGEQRGGHASIVAGMRGVRSRGGL